MESQTLLGVMTWLCFILLSIREPHLAARWDHEAVMPLSQLGTASGICRRGEDVHIPVKDTLAPRYAMVYW